MTDVAAQSRVRVLPNVIDQIAKDSPEQTWAYIPRSNDNLQDGYKVITFRQLSQSVNKMARWMDKTLGKSNSRETIAYMDRANDIRYVFTIVAAMKTGHPILLSSVRNSQNGHQNLLRRVGCTKFLHSAEMETEVLALADSETPVEAFQIPSLEELMQGDPEEYISQLSEDPEEVAIIIHTSGSTGLPKPIPLRNGYIAIIDRLSRMRRSDGRMMMSQKFGSNAVTLSSLPWFHAMGLFMFVKSVFSQGPLVLPPLGRTPNANLTIEMIQYGKPQCAFFPPSILEDIVDTPGGLETLATIDFILFAGAPLSKEIGDRIAKVTRIQTIIGSTEAAILDSLVSEDGSDWNYFEWTPEAGVTMEESSGLHELVVKKLDNGLQGAFFSFPEIDEWHTKDLYEQHPTKPGLWQYRGRNDDVIVLSNGEKFNPVSYEKSLEGHPKIKGALVVGQGRFQSGLLLELSKQQDPESFLDEIWPFVEQANENMAAHGRVWKSKIAIARPDKPFERAPKGNIMRRMTNILFEKEIDALYSNEGFIGQISNLTNSADESAVEDMIRQAVRLTLTKVPENIADTADLFSYGIDSLQVLGLSSALNHAMPKQDGSRDSAIKPRLIYSNPTIESLTKAVYDVLHGIKDDASSRSRQDKMADMVEKYTTNLPSPIEYNPRQQKHAAILTGSTGTLGNYILQTLMSDPSVSKIYCLNRADAESRQKQSFAERRAAADFSKVVFLQASLSKERFGLSPEVYKELEDCVDIFIHNAWAVNFNMDLESFDDNVAGTRACVDFCASAKYHPHIMFISSVASTGAWLATGRTGFIPEEFFHDDSLPLSQGYGESKHVASRILATASEKSKIPTSIVRVGQVAGTAAEKGLVWNKHEWFPSIIASSKAIGKIPRTLGVQDVIDWVPLDTAAQILVDIVHARTHTQAEKKLDVFHLINPQTASWEKLVPAVQGFYGASGIDLEVVEFKDWIAALRKLPATQEEFQRVPGLKLLDFYEGLVSDQGGLPRMATTHTAQSSSTIRELGPVNKDMIVNWLKQWNF
ncbi:hypothetical protein MBLNU459_g0944t1 [Dothideomycetes sp. NU459]